MLGLGHWGYIGHVIVLTNSLVLSFFETSPNIRMVVIDDKMSPNMLFNAWTSRRHPGALLGRLEGALGSRPRASRGCLDGSVLRRLGDISLRLGSVLSVWKDSRAPSTNSVSLAPHKR